MLIVTDRLTKIHNPLAAQQFIHKLTHTHTYN